MIQRRDRGHCRATPVGGPLGSGELVEEGWALCWVLSVHKEVKTIKDTCSKDDIYKFL